MELVVVENVAGEMILMWSWEAHSLQQSLSKCNKVNILFPVSYTEGSMVK